MRGAGWRARATWRNEDALGMFGGGASGPDGETRSRRGERERLRGARPTNRVWSVYIGYSCIIAKSEETTTQKKGHKKHCARVFCGIKCMWQGIKCTCMPDRV